MFDGIPLQFLTNVSPWTVTVAVVLVVFRMIYTGKLKPRSTYLDEQAEQEKLVGILMTALDAERETNSRLTLLVRELQAPSAKAVDILETVQEVSKSGPGS